MINSRFKHWIYMISVFLAASVAALWSWNTLSELYSWPLAQFKHVLAVFILLLLIRWSLFAKHHRSNRLSGLYPDQRV